MANKNDILELGRAVTEGRYVRKTTLYISVAVALVLGAYVGNLATGLATPPRPVEKRAVATPSAPQGQQAPMASETTGRILELEQAVIKSPDDVVAWVHLGNLYFDTDQPKEAIRAYEKALTLKPAQPDVLTDLGVMYRAIHEHDKALATFDKALAANPKHQVAMFNKGIVLLHDLKRTKEAVAAWRALLAVNPDARAPDGTPVRDIIKELDGK